MQKRDLSSLDLKSLENPPPLCPNCGGTTDFIDTKHERIHCMSCGKRFYKQTSKGDISPELPSRISVAPKSHKVTPVSMQFNDDTLPHFVPISPSPPLSSPPQPVPESQQPSYPPSCPACGGRTSFIDQKRDKIACHECRRKFQRIIPTIDTKKYSEAQIIARPRITIDFEGHLYSKVWNRLLMIVRNVGSREAHDIRFKISGTCEIQRLKELDVLKTGEKRSLELAFYSERAGSVPIDIQIQMRAPPDGRLITDIISTWLEVIKGEEALPVFGPADIIPDSKAKPQASLTRTEGGLEAKKVSSPTVLETPMYFQKGEDAAITGDFIILNVHTYCNGCGGIIKKGAHAYACKCGTALHEECAGKLRICPSCKSEIYR